MWTKQLGDHGLPTDGRRFLAEKGNAHHRSVPGVIEWGSARGGVP